MCTEPGPGTTKSVARYWSPCACRPMMIGLVQPGTKRGMVDTTIGSRNTTPPRMLRMVPLGERHIFFSPNSLTRASSGVIVAPVPLDGVGRVHRHLVAGGVPVLHGQVVVVQRDIEVGQDQLVLDELPDDP